MTQQAARPAISDVVRDFGEAVAPVYLDAKGLSCPVPIIRMRKALLALPLGGVLVVDVTDPGAPQDFASFCEVAGHHLLASTEADGIFTLEIRRAR